MKKLSRKLIIYTTLGNLGTISNATLNSAPRIRFFTF